MARFSTGWCLHDSTQEKTAVKHKYIKVAKNGFLFFLIGALAVFNSILNKSLAGAITPFTKVEAEAGTLGGGATISSFVLGSSVPT
jgi:hypothetical protein